jgi:hypothetical protein
MGFRGFEFAVEGDSRAALAWAENGRVASTIARRAAIGFSFAVSATQAMCSATNYITSLMNKLCDSWSRGEFDAATSDIDPRLEFPAGPGTVFYEFTRQCDPQQPLEGGEAHAHLSGFFATACSALQP